MKELLKNLNFNEKGLIPAIIQDDKSGRVLTLCYMNKEALTKTLKEGKVYLFRRSKNELMLKGKTSGHVQIVKTVYIDCASNSLLFKVQQKVAACHAGYFTCYYQKINSEGKLEIREEKVFDPSKTYA